MNLSIEKQNTRNMASIIPVTASTSSSWLGPWYVTPLAGENGTLVLRLRPSMKL